jgi:hypothetical protein
MPGLEGGLVNSEDEEEDVEGPASVGEGEEEKGVMDVESGEEVWVRPEEVRSAGFSQFPAPPRPVWRYSGAG